MQLLNGARLSILSATDSSCFEFNTDHESLVKIHIETLRY